MRGVAAPREQSGIMEEQGSRTDGREPAICGSITPTQGGDPRIRSELFHVWASGEEKAVHCVILGKALQKGVAAQDDARATGDFQCSGGGAKTDLNAGTAEQVHGGDGLDFLKTIRDDCEHLGHEPL